jgi:hypothetical protein
MTMSAINQVYSWYILLTKRYIYFKSLRFTPGIYWVYT